MANEIYIAADNTDEILGELHSKIEMMLEAIGITAEGYAKLLCPVDTGRLINSISHAADSEAAYIGTNVEYAPYVEMGTSRTRAKPFLKPAATEHTSEYEAIAISIMKE